MRHRYKTSAVVACFVAFYVGITPLGTICIEPANNCTFIRELVINTRLTVPGGSDDIEYTGTVQGVEEPNVGIFISDNIPFFAVMVIAPVCVILAIAFIEKRRNSVRPIS